MGVLQYDFMGDFFLGWYFSGYLSVISFVAEKPRTIELNAGFSSKPPGGDFQRVPQGSRTHALNIRRLAERVLFRMMRILPANSEGCWRFIFVVFSGIFLSFGFAFVCHFCFALSFFGHLVLHFIVIFFVIWFCILLSCFCHLVLHFFVIFFSFFSSGAGG